MNRVLCIIVISALVLFVKTWTAEGLSLNKGNNGLIKLEISPTSTDSNIKEKGTSHLAYVDSAVRKIGKLFVFFPGTGAPPNFYTKILETAASQGFHAIGLVYENDRSVNFHICTQQRVRTDPNCHKNVRLEILDGIDRTPLVDVNRANSIENRLIKLLEYLQQKQPDTKWGQFLSDSKLHWEAIAFSGHSQGGGHAAMVGKVHSSYRIVMFSAPEPAAWTTENLNTPPDSYYGLVHKLESIHNPIVLAWKKLGVPGAPVNADGQPSSFIMSHQLVTSVTPVGPPDKQGLPNYHNSVVVDDFTPVGPDGVTPVLRDVWIYLLTSQAGN